MDFNITGIYKRSITIEADNEERYEAAAERRTCILRDGKVVRELASNRNVVTLDGLEPDCDYVIRQSAGDESAEKAFRTRHESVLLDVRRFGATGDGITDDSAALQAAIACCPADGTVYVPAGTYLSKPLFLKSHITLWLDEGAVLLGDPDRRHYPILPGMIRATDEKVEHELNLTSWEGNPLDSFASLITGMAVEDVDLVGRGVVDGNGSNGDWWVNQKVKRIAWRPNLIFLNHCTNIRVQGITIRNSPGWTVHPYYCDHVTFMDVAIRNPYHSPNTDGFDPESCTDVRLIGSVISVGDDCIAVKSGKLYMARFHYKRTENVVIRNCLLERGHGSVTIGSEIAGGVTKVSVSQCIFRETDRGLRVKTRRGRGDCSVLDDIVFDNITMDRVLMPITVNMFYFCDPDGHSSYVQDMDAKPVDEDTPVVGNVTLRNADCTGISAAMICAMGLPEQPIRELCLENVRGEFLPEGERTPAQPVMTDNIGKVEGIGVYAVNVDTLRMKNVTVKGSRDTQPRCTNVRHLVMEGTTFAG